MNRKLLFICLSLFLAIIVVIPCASRANNDNEKLKLPDNPIATDIDSKLLESGEVLRIIDEKMSELDKMIENDMIELTDEQIGELNMLKKSLKDNLLTYQSNIFFVIKYKSFALWIHMQYPPIFMILPPHKPLNQGILLSVWNVPEKKLPTVFVFGDYHETVHLIPKINTPVALIGCGASISRLGDAAFKVTYDMTLPKKYNARYSLVANFNIFDCNRDFGGGIYVNNSKVLFLLNKVHRCSANIMGGGIGCVADISVPLYMGVNPLFICNEVYNCTAPDGGGMAFMDDGQSFAIGNKVHDNFAANSGGGVHFYKSGNYFIANSVFKNSTNGSGGGISLNEAGKVIMGANYIADNTSPNNGGGIYVTNGGMIPPVIVWNRILGNTATMDGGGIYVDKDADAAILTIVTTLGEKIVTLVCEYQTSGKYEIIWNGRNESGRTLPSGVYIINLDIENSKGRTVKTAKMVNVQ